jgi:hypothetical protein
VLSAIVAKSKANQSRTTVFLILFTISCAGTLLFSCVPVAASWDFSLRAHAKCFSTNTFTAIGLYNSGESPPPPLGKAAVSSADKLTVVNIVTDTTLALLPVPLVWNLQLNMRTKATLTMVLGLGFLYASMLTDVVCLAAC